MLAGPLKPSSIRQAMTILHNCYEWMLLHDRAGITRNPFRRVRVQKDQTAHFEERMLSTAAIEQINATIAAYPGRAYVTSTITIAYVGCWPYC
jgi:hypothetical protein